LGRSATGGKNIRIYNEENILVTVTCKIDATGATSVSSNPACRSKKTNSSKPFIFILYKKNIYWTDESSGAMCQVRW